MHLSVIASIVQDGLVLPITTASVYGYGLLIGAVACVIAWFVREAWVRRSAGSGSADSLAEVAPAAASEPGSDAAKAKKPRKLNMRDLMYIAGIYVGTNMIAQGLQERFKPFPAEALVWGVETGFVLCLMLIFVIRFLMRRKTSTGQEM